MPLCPRIVMPEPIVRVWLSPLSLNALAWFWPNTNVPVPPMVCVPLKLRKA